MNTSEISLYFACDSCGSEEAMTVRLLAESGNPLCMNRDCEKYNAETDYKGWTHS